MTLIIVVMTVHSIAEGVAIGASFAGGATLAALITVAIAVHNIPEGLAISAVLRPRGASIAACAWWSFFSSIPQPLVAVPAFLFVDTFQPALPYGMGFAAGAMVFMVLVELLPEAYGEGRRAPVALLVSATLVAMVVFQEEGANLIRLGRGLRVKLDELREEFSDYGLDFVVNFDASELVEEQLGLGELRPELPLLVRTMVTNISRGVAAADEPAVPRLTSTGSKGVRCGVWSVWR